MPIRVSCQCGKALNVQDAMAGKAVKCPGCGNAIRVPAAGAAKPQPTPAAKPQPTPAIDPSMHELFDEEGFSEEVAAVCPSCRREMPPGAVLCTKCGFNKETGERLEAHKTAGVDIDFGELALMKAESDLAHAKKLQQEMLSKAGLPWWGLALVLFVIGTSVSIGVITVNVARRAEGKEVDFDPVATFMALTGVAFAVVAGGMLSKLLWHAFKKNATKGQIIKLVLGVIILGGIAAGLFVAANNR